MVSDLIFNGYSSLSTSFYRYFDRFIKKIDHFKSTACLGTNPRSDPWKEQNSDNRKLNVFLRVQEN